MSASSPWAAPRTQPDRCPGLLRPHQAADGALVRLRIPGGVISAAALTEVAAVATEFGDGQVRLTSRGNLQLRSVPVDAEGDVPAEMVDRIAAAGLLPSARHELVRNIVCSPLTGRVGGRADLRPLLAELDARLCASSELAALPGRFLFALDDGRGDVLPLAHDLGVLAVDAEYVRLSAAGAVGAPIPLHRAAGELLVLARRFLARRGAAWHVRELDGAPLIPDAGDPMLPLGGPLDFGRLTQVDGQGLLSLGVPLATLTADQVDAVATAATRSGSGMLVVTPWRGLLLPDLREDAAQPAAAGLILDPESPWRNISACAGAPGCVKAAAATRPVAALLAGTGCSASTPGVHVVACARRCGAPSGEHIQVLAGPSGFTVSGPSGRPDINCDAAHLAQVVARARNGS
ncbi:precorrin-3B synthase [Nakamurella panacisegetis]|uniref:precorrin-3B synthase n=1 Tax=Nakamurella panacisegetis TaxID=1090615 RepID=UPI0018D38A71|nr:precorrin-3B synthase [Nakamurella panacisegetis]